MDIHRCEPARKRRKISLATSAANPPHPTSSTSASSSDTSEFSQLASARTKPRQAQQSIDSYGSGYSAHPPIQQRSPYRSRSIYPTVAGRVTLQGHINLPSDLETKPTSARTYTRIRDTQIRSGLPLAPPEVLLSVPDAPERHEEPEWDVYGAHRWLRQYTRENVYRKIAETDKVRRWSKNKGELPGWSVKDTVEELEKERQEEQIGEEAGQKDDGVVEAERFLKRMVDGNEELRLPDSDLLKAVHRYCSHFYDAMASYSAENEVGSECVGGGGGEGVKGGGRRVDQTTENKTNNIASSGDWYSLDETALLAFGILLEETCRSLISATTSISTSIRRTPARAGSAASRTTKRDKATRSTLGEGWRALSTSHAFADPDPSEKFPNYLYAIEKRAQMPFQRGTVPRGVVRRDRAKVRAAASRRLAKERARGEAESERVERAGKWGGVEGEVADQCGEGEISRVAGKVEIEDDEDSQDGGVHVDVDTSSADEVEDGDKDTDETPDGNADEHRKKGPNPDTHLNADPDSNGSSSDSARSWDQDAEAQDSEGLFPQGSSEDRSSIVKTS